MDVPNVGEVDVDDEEVLVNALIQIADTLFGDDEDISDVRERGQWVKIAVDVESYMNLPDLTFKMHFRMSRPVFEQLFQVVFNHLERKGRLKRIRTPPPHALMMALWILFNPDSFRSTALHFGTSPGVVHFHYLVVIEALTELVETYVRWPSAAERQNIKDNFERRHGFPGVAGAMDTSHFYFTAPCGNDKQSFLNRHHSFSILAQTVCDNRFLVRDLYVGEPGSLHDSRIFRRSPLCDALLTRPEMLAEDEHIIADGGYVCTDKVLVPFRNNGHLTAAQKYFNRTLSSARSIIERLYRLVKCRMRRCKNFESHCLAYAVESVTALFVIHNFLILSNEEEEEVADTTVPSSEELWPEDVDPEWNYPSSSVEPDHSNYHLAKARGAVKR